MDSKHIKTEKVAPRFMASIFFAVLLVGTASIFPVLSLYLRNINEVDFHTVIPLIELFLGIGFVFFCFFSLCFRKISAAALYSFIAILIFQYYMPFQDVVQKLFPRLKSIHILPTTLVLVLCIIIVTNNWLSKVSTFKMVRLLSCGFVAFLLAASASAMPGIRASSSLRILTNHEVGAWDKKPNLYYFIFDEYSNSNILQKYYEFDNSPFERFLTDKKFVVSRQSRNECDSTAMVTAHLMMLDYTFGPGEADKQLNKSRENGVLRNLLTRSGYELIGVGMSHYFNIPSKTYHQGRKGPTTLAGTTFSELLIFKTPIKLFLPATPRGRARAKILHDVRDYFLQASNYTKRQGRFTLSYLQFPHEPFVFTSTGSLNDERNWHNWREHKYYLGQLQYVSQVIKQIVEGILRHDPKGVIIIQSDHGARYVIDPETGEPISRDKRIWILNAVYFSGELIDIDGKSGVNTLRAVLSRLLNIELPEVEVPYARFGSKG